MLMSSATGIALRTEYRSDELNREDRSKRKRVGHFSLSGILHTSREKTGCRLPDAVIAREQQTLSIGGHIRRAYTQVHNCGQDTKRYLGPVM
jgi:hypothetical protein